MARGAAPEECLAELMSKATGLCGAKGGSMHLTKASKGMLGSYAIVGAHLPIAAGAAWSAQLRGTGQVSVAFFGDGATNIGAFHEALNLASVWALPVLFICENNLYMEYTAIGSVTAVAHPAADRAPAYNLPAEVIDGNDVVAVRDTVAAAAQRARSGGGPTVIEAMTYRHFGHSRTDPGDLPAGRGSPAVAPARPAGAGESPAGHLGVPPSQVADADEAAAAVVRQAVAAAKAAPGPIPLVRWPMYGQMEARHGGRDHVPGSGRRGPRPGTAPRPRGGVPGRGHRRRRWGLQDHGQVCSASSAANGCGTPRSPSRRSWASRWARR